MEAKVAEAPSFIVGIGASAGGLEALERMLKGMPVDTGMAFVIIQHLSPHFESLMSELLARHTKMPIIPVMEATQIRANSIYLLPPRKEMIMAAGRLVVHERPTTQQLIMPINVFFRSLAREAKDRSIAIVLSGTGTDGSAGLMDIHDVNGLVIVQSEESAKFDGMPRSAIDTGLADLVLAPEEMPGALKDYALSPEAPLSRTKYGRISPDAATGLPAILDRLREVYGIDFTYYKPATISRRIDRRISMVKSSSFGEYSRQVLEEPAELDALYKDLLIGVTRFFRDPEAFAIIADRVLPSIIESTPLDDELRVWVAGCATGQEAYSLAMLLVEALERMGRRNQVRIFASDAHRESLQIASEGLYDEQTMEDVSQERRDHFFLREGNRYRVAPMLRKMLILSPQNILKDPPFTRMDLVSCRNLLIYFQAMAQTKALASLHFALKIGGALFLGPSESSGEVEDQFEITDRQWKIYRKVRDSRLPLELRMNSSPSMGRAMARPMMPGDLRLARAYDALLSRYIPPGVLVNERREVLHVFNEADRYLRPPVGRMSNDIVSMVRGDLRMALSSAITAALKKGERVSFRGVRIRALGSDHDALLGITVDPLADKATNSTHLFILFEEETPLLPKVLEPSEQFQAGEASQARIQQLELELQQTKESLQSTVEELETSNEELQASNEELLAANEELQSTNEELHSVNEELYSVNAEHEQKIKELIETTNDLNNLMRSTEIGTIFLDRSHCVRLFTPKASQIFNLLPQDIGRDIKHITYRVRGDEIFDEIEEVFRNPKTLEKRVFTPDGRSYLRRMMPYQDEERRMAGLVMTFVEVTDLTRAEASLRERTVELETAIGQLGESEETFRTLVEGSPQSVIMVDAEGKVVFINSQTERLFGYARAELVGQTVELLVPAAAGARHMASRMAYMEAPVARPMSSGRELMGVRKDGLEIPVEIGLSPLRLKGRVFILCTIIDIRGRREAELALRESEARFRAVTETLPQLVWTSLPDGQCDYFGPQWIAYTGVSGDEQLKSGWMAQVHADDHGKAVGGWADAVSNGSPFDVEFRLRRGDGAYRWFKTRAVPLYGDEGRILKWFGTSTDIDDLRRAEEQATASLQEKETLLKEIHHRVKNNMQLVSSLLQLQSDYITNPEALSVFREGQNRVRSMALIHERLYRAGSLSQIDLAEYVRSLVNMLMPAYSVNKGKVSVNIRAARVELGIDTAVPLGLILNELISNALKHAFPADREGSITIDLVAEPDSEVSLLVGDDGVGLPSGFDWQSCTSLGLHLVKILAGQIDGQLEVRSEGGLKVSLRFREAKKRRGP
ncbi:MAG: PAS domain S-box protein [Verrucomicrobiales bacterium]|nr:PAS domain S-box protein [Verrucomicrobiales bacterium]